VYARLRPIPNIRQADRETVSQRYHIFATLRKELAFPPWARARTTGVGLLRISRLSRNTGSIPGSVSMLKASTVTWNRLCP
jgi:hypothetical protein